jgi:hypothetical protein
VSLQYRKAVRADADSAFILRQLETYWPVFDEHGKGEGMSVGNCPLCRYGKLCEMCYLRKVGDTSAAAVVGVGRMAATRVCHRRH